MIIKVYNKDFTLLTTLFNNVENSDFNNLSYRNQVNGIGDASFMVRIDNAKITPTNIKHYNRIEVCEDDGTVKFVGVIIEKDIELNTINVKCYGLGHMLDKRLTADGAVFSGQANTQVTNMINTMNGIEDTGIDLGTLDVTSSVNLTFNQSKILSAIKSIADAVNAQFIINTDRTLDFQTIVGQDLSSTIRFGYQKDEPKLANIVQFKIGDDGKPIISKSFGKSGTLNSAQLDVPIHGEFGLLEDFKNFAESNNQGTLDNMTANNNQASDLNPTIALSPDVEDNFNAGDIVQIVLDNGHISIDTPYQIFEKSVKVVNNTQKLITIKLNLETKGFLDDFKKMKENIELLNRIV